MDLKQIEGDRFPSTSNQKFTNPTYTADLETFDCSGRINLKPHKTWKNWVNGLARTGRSMDDLLVFPAISHECVIILQFETSEVAAQVRCTCAASSGALPWLWTLSSSPSPASSSKTLRLGRNAPALPPSDPWASP